MTPPTPLMIQRFLANSSSYSEAEEVAHFLENNPEVIDEIILTEDLLETEIVIVGGRAKQEVFNSITSTFRARLLTIKRWAIAACLIGLVGISLYFFQDKDGSHSFAEKELKLKNKTTLIQRFNLPDSSQLILRPGAEVAYRSNFSTHRFVKVLAGDVFFRVAKDELHQFNVVTNGISTTAIGTQFWIQHFSDSEVEISLVEGKVFIHSIDKSFKMDTVFLQVGQSCYVNKNSSHVAIFASDEVKNLTKKPMSTKQSAVVDDESNAIIWTNQEIRFSNAKLENMFNKLEQMYNVKIVVYDSSILQHTISGKIFHTDSLSVLVKSIADLNKLSYEIRNDTVVFKR